MGIMPTNTSIPSEGDVLKAPRIQIAALLYILFNSFIWYDIGALLQNQSWNPYSTIGRIQHLYSCCFWRRNIPRNEFPRSFIYLTMNNALFEQKSKYWRNINFQLKKNPKYFQESLEQSMGPSRGVRLKGEGLNANNLAQLLYYKLLR